MQFSVTYTVYILCDSLWMMSKIISSLPALSSPGVGILPVVLVPTVLVVMIIALLCGLICVVYQLKKEVKYVTVHSIVTYHNIP